MPTDESSEAAMTCPECGSETTSVTKTADMGDVTFRRRRCDCGAVFRTEERLMATTTTRKQAAATAISGHRQPLGAISGQGPPLDATCARPWPLMAGGGVGGDLSLGSGSDSDLSGDRSDPRGRSGRARSQETRKKVTGWDLVASFGVVRSQIFTHALPWSAPRGSTGKADTLAATFDDHPEAEADVVPTMRLLLEHARDGASGPESAKIAKDPTFGFGAWLAQFTALREELHGMSPETKAPAGGNGRASRTDAVFEKFEREGGGKS